MTFCRRSIVSFLLGSAITIGASTAPAQTEVSAALSGALPALFPAGSLNEAAIGGERGARIVAPTPEATTVGLRAGDVVLSVAGIRLSATSDLRPAIEAAIAARGEPTFTIWRTVPGERPVIEPARIGNEVVGDFVALSDADQSPMRLACMLANQETLVKDGAGVVLLPATDSFDAAIWLRDANPMPQASETALREVVDAMVRRVDIPAASEGELARATELMGRNQFLEAQERARRAMVQAVVDPATRADATTLRAATQLHIQAGQSNQEEQLHRMNPEPLFGIVAEGLVDRIEAFLPQNTLLDVDAATGYGFAAGARVRLAFDSVPVLRDLFLLGKYGQLRHTFDDGAGNDILSTTLQQVSIEMLYRPRVPSRLRPFVSAGVGAFPLSGRIHCPEGELLAFRDTEVGALFGGGLDFFTISAWHLRGSIAGSYRILHSKFSVDSAPLLYDCRNAPPDFNLADLDNGYYEFDMDGWQIGLLLTLEF